MNLAEVKAAYEAIHGKDLAWDIGIMVARARIQKQLSQKELADLCKMKQPSIARLETGNHLPTVRILKIVADALNLNLKIILE